MTELKDIPEFEGMYKIDILGNIYAQGKLKAIIKHRVNVAGYPIVSLGRFDKRGTRFVHKLIAQAFITNPGNKKEVNHINGIKADFRIENLEWVTPSENMHHSFRIGLRKGLAGEQQASAKLTNQNIIDIRSLHGTLSQHKIAKKFNVSQHSIWLIVHNRSWKHI